MECEGKEHEQKWQQTTCFNRQHRHITQSYWIWKSAT